MYPKLQRRTEKVLVVKPPLESSGGKTKHFALLRIALHLEMETKHFLVSPRQAVVPVCLPAYRLCRGRVSASLRRLPWGKTLWESFRSVSPFKLQLKLTGLTDSAGRAAYDSRRMSGVRSQIFMWARKIFWTKVVEKGERQIQLPVHTSRYSQGFRDG
jgi:hypothetical protein